MAVVVADVLRLWEGSEIVQCGVGCGAHATCLTDNGPLLSRYFMDWNYHTSGVDKSLLTFSPKSVAKGPSLSSMSVQFYLPSVAACDFQRVCLKGYSAILGNNQRCFSLSHRLIRPSPLLSPIE